MNRRRLMALLAAAAGSWGFTNTRTRIKPTLRPDFSLDGNHLRFFHPAIQERFTIFMLADTHLFRDDDRGIPFRDFSGRMAKAYNQTKHFQTGAITHPEACFEATLALAVKEEAKMLALIGDIFSFPSEAAIEWVSEKLQLAQTPYLYTAGNHDWHYEGMPGSLADLRATWIHQRLLPLYQGQDPLMSVREINGVRFIALDNSTYEITQGQLEFFRKEVATGMPLLLMLHIPLYAPERPLGFGCGHPAWNAENDKSYKLERRERWPEAGHSATTMAFYREVLAAPHLLGVLAGHIHAQSLDVLNGLPQVVTAANANGGFLKVEFLPALGSTFKKS